VVIVVLAETGVGTTVVTYDHSVPVKGEREKTSDTQQSNTGRTLMLMDFLQNEIGRKGGQESEERCSGRCRQIRTRMSIVTKKKWENPSSPKGDYARKCT
jgi:hypothetical protein